MDDELLGLLPEGDAETSLAWLGDHLEDFDVQFVGSDEPLSVALGEQSSGQEEDDDNVAIAGADTATAATTATTIRRARQRSDSENTRRLPYRQRQKLELASLRSRVAEMQYELRFLRSQRNARNANGQDATTKSSALDMSALPWALDNARPDGNGSTGGSVWQTLAKLQLQARAFAEQENANLKQALREQLEMSKELERILLRNHSLHSNAQPLRSILPRTSSWNSSQTDLKLLVHVKPTAATGSLALANPVDSRTFFMTRFMAPLFSLGRWPRFSEFAPPKSLSDVTEGTALWRPELRLKPAHDTQSHSHWFAAKRCQSSKAKDEAVAKQEKTPCWSGWGLFERLSSSLDAKRRSFGQQRSVHTATTVASSDDDLCRQPRFSRMRFRIHRTLIRSPSASWAAAC